MITIDLIMRMPCARMRMLCARHAHAMRTHLDAHAMRTPCARHAHAVRKVPFHVHGHKYCNNARLKLRFSGKKALSLLINIILLYARGRFDQKCAPGCFIPVVMIWFTGIFDIYLVYPP